MVRPLGGGLALDSCLLVDSHGKLVQEFARAELHCSSSQGSLAWMQSSTEINLDGSVPVSSFCFKIRVELTQSGNESMNLLN